MQMLRKFQQGFARAVFDTRAAGRFAPQVRAHGLSGPRRIQVYRNNLFANLSEALAATYPVIHRLVGEAYFQQLATVYVRKFPSVSGDIHRYGDRFGEFLGQRPGAVDHPYLADVAALEWAYHQVFHSARVPGLDLETLSNIPQGDYPFLRFRLQPAARLLASPYPILRIWQVTQTDGRGDQSVSLSEGPVYLKVEREAFQVVLQPLKVGEYVLLQRLNMGETLTEAHAWATDAEPSFDLGTTLRRLVAQGTLSEAYIEEPTRAYNQIPTGRAGRSGTSGAYPDSSPSYTVHLKTE
jgi:hypothetical protein